MRILLVDDDAALRRPLSLLLEEAGHEVVTETDGEAGLARALRDTFDALLCDIQLPRLDGMTLLRRYRESEGRGIVIMISAFGSEEEALKAIREGAWDYIRKPFVVDEVLRALAKAEARAEQAQTANGVGGGTRDPVRTIFVGESREMRRVMALLRHAASRDLPVLVSGEPGTGKEFVARTIHRLSARPDAPFLTIACDAIPGTLLAAELLGDRHGGRAAGRTSGGDDHTAGIVARAGAAGGGTIYLGSADALDSAVQQELLALLAPRGSAEQNGAPHATGPIRWVAGSDIPLEWLVQERKFNAELFVALDGIRITLPPLRERREDIPMLVANFAHRIATRIGRPVSVTPSALHALVHHEWPGNIRQLRQVLDRVGPLSTSGEIGVDDLQLGLETNGVPGGMPVGGFALRPQVEAVERDMITRALTASHGNRKQAAKLLRVSVRTLFYKLNRLGMETVDDRR